MLLYNKRAELTTTQIVGLVILILSFIVILLLIFQLNLGETTQKELCRDSVILKGKSFLPSGSSALNCKEEYVCFSKTDSCDKPEKPDRIVKVASKNGLYRAIGDEMADCWWMFGEGKINYVGSELVPDLYCSICSDIYFDSSIKDIIGEGVSQKEFYQYLSNINYSNQGNSYYKYIFGRDYEEINAQFENFDVNKKYIILMGSTSEVSVFGWVAGAVAVGVVVGASVATGGLALIPLTTVGVVGAGIGAAAGGLFSGIVSYGLSGLSYLRPVIVEKDSDHFSAYKCKHIITRS
jgi:hypothetical protein